VKLGSSSYAGGTPTEVFNSGNTNTSGSWTKVMGPNASLAWFVYANADGLGPTADPLCTRYCHTETNSSYWYLPTTQPIFPPTSVVVSSTSAGGSSLSSVRVTWQKQTHIPDNMHGYQVYYRKTGTANFTLAGTVAGTAAYSLDINGLIANTLYDIAVRTYTNNWGGHHSTLAARSKPAGGYEELSILNKNATAYTDTDAIPGYRYTYQLVLLNGNGSTIKTVTTTGYRKPNGVIKGTVRTTGGAGVQGVQVCAVASPAVSPAGAGFVPPGGYCATTDAAGKYEIRGVYYYDEASFVVTPSFPGHKFGPANQRVTLDLNSFNAAAIDFIDSTSVSIFGKVHFPSASQFGGTGTQIIGIKDAIIKVDTVDRGIRTDQNGNWSFAVTAPGPIEFSVEYLHHTFNQTKQTVTAVDQDC
jgi:hypothetical protein